MVKKNNFAGFTISPGEIGYALGMETAAGTEITKCGVVSFDDGMLHGKKGESSACAARRERRSARKVAARRRIRKIETLRVLSSMGCCPSLSEDSLREWRYGKLYSNDAELRKWLSTDILNNVNPYRDRYECITRKLDFSVEADRFTFGRAIYHMCQRRGYLSNAKDEKSQRAAGEINKGIEALTKEIGASGCPTLGAYFYRKLQAGEPVRRCYTGREVHYAAEFNRICDFQGICGKDRDRLYRAVFIHRPLKSQKRNVGRCVFENSRVRCQRSHPLFEEYRMWQFINNIKVRQRGEDRMRALNSAEVDVVLPLFYRAARNFKFEDIAKALAGKGRTYSSASSYDDTDLVFNYKMDTSVTGNPTIYQIIAVLGKGSGADWRNWRDVLGERYVLKGDKDIDSVVTDVWHVMMFFDDIAKERDWFRRNLGVSDEKDLERISKYAPETEYSEVSLYAVRRILPYMQQGYRFDEAVFFANLDKVLPKGVTWEFKDKIEKGVTAILDSGKEGNFGKSKGELIREYLLDACPDSNPDLLYHPSLVSKFRDAETGPGGCVILGNPDNGSIKNPVVHRAESELRKLVNALSREGYIGRDTVLRVEVSTRLHGMNARRGLDKWREEREDLRGQAVEEIERFFEESGERVNVTEDQVTKWLLWKEQKGVCLYTGRQISLAQFLGPKAEFDIEHTVPVSRGGDDSLMNKTLCESLFNRNVKRDRLPSELDPEVYGALLSRVESLGWDAEVKTVYSEMVLAKDKAKKNVKDKDSLIAKAAYLKEKSEYLEGKIHRLKMTRVPEGFGFRQDSAATMARNHIVAFLKSGYDRVFSESEETVRSFRSIWGLPSRYEYDRDCHRKNCIDAVVTACITVPAYRKWQRYWTEHDGYSWMKRPVFARPWETFVEDVLAKQEEIMIPYDNRDNLSRGRRHKVRDTRGRVMRDAMGNPIFQDSDCSGMSLHKESYFACRKTKDGTLAFGKRSGLDSRFTAKQAESIVDERLRAAVLKTLSEEGGAGLKDFRFLGNRVRHVRLGARNLPYIPLKKHRDESKSEYKRNVYVENDKNYCVAFYDGGECAIVRPIDVIRRKKEGLPPVEPVREGNKLRGILRPGTQVLFYESDRKELLGASARELVRRLYTLKGLAMSDGNVVLSFKHAAEKLPDGACEDGMGYWKNDDSYRPVVKTMTKKCNILIEGVDFFLNRCGDIVWR